MLVVGLNKRNGKKHEGPSYSEADERGVQGELLVLMEEDCLKTLSMLLMRDRN